MPGEGDRRRHGENVPSPWRSGERTALGQGPLTPLTLQVRALYEGGVVPVCDIARFAGVSLRTLYYYIHRYGWRRRRADEPRDKAKALRQRERYLARKAQQPQAPRGMKALDPGAQAEALARCLRAAALSDDALGRTRRLRETLSRTRTLSLMMAALRELAALEGARKPAEAAEPKRDIEELRRELARRLEARLRGWEAEEALAAAAPASLPSEAEPLTEQDRRLNAIAARFYAKRR